MPAEELAKKLLIAFEKQGFLLQEPYVDGEGRLDCVRIDGCFNLLDIAECVNKREDWYKLAAIAFGVTREEAKKRLLAAAYGAEEKLSDRHFIENIEARYKAGNSVYTVMEIARLFELAGKPAHALLWRNANAVPHLIEPDLLPSLIERAKRFTNDDDNLEKAFRKALNDFDTLFSNARPHMLKVQVEYFEKALDEAKRDFERLSGKSRNAGGTAPDQ